MISSIVIASRGPNQRHVSLMGIIQLPEKAKFKSSDTALLEGKALALGRT